MSDPFDPGHLIGHVKDSTHFEVPRFVHPEGKLRLPQPWQTKDPIAELKVGFAPIDDRIGPLDLKITKFMVLELVAAVLLAVIFIRLANRAAKGDPPRGRWWNLL